MKTVLLLFALLSTLFSAEVVELDKKYVKSQKCKACHNHLVKDWEESWHYKSHYKNDEYFRATIDYISRKTRKSLNSIKVQCARCHNPRISVTSTDMSYEIETVMNLQTNKEVDNAVNNENISEGINCVVCHNIDKIHKDENESVRGMDRVEWAESGTMIGPFADAFSPYHKTQKRDFMDEESNTLCFVCHANDRSLSGLIFTNMEKEYAGNVEKCVECHMGPRREDVAATLKLDHGKSKKRDIRSHKFPGGHIESFVFGALTLTLQEEDADIALTLFNPNPHNIPSGFGSRELLIEVLYKKGTKVIEKQKLSLTRYFTRKGGRASIPHLALKASKDTSVPAKGEKVIKVAKIQKATNVEVRVYYRLVNDEVRALLKLKEPIWSQKSLVTSGSLELK